MTISDRVNLVLQAEAAAIAGIPVTLAFDHAVQQMRGSRLIITTGMGKAGHVARKCASTLCSTGTPATYLHPGEAAHGDLGIIQPGTVLLAFSTSGKTREVLDLVTQGRALGLDAVIGITGHQDSGLRLLSDCLIDLGEITEPCPLGLTPSASTAAMMAIGDALALALLEVKGFTREEFGARHHGGYLGQVVRVDQEVAL